MSFELTPLSLPDLLTDPENPRLPQPNIGQREALRALAEHQRGKLIALAKDIVQFGMNPAESLIVMPINDDLKRYVVLEGNRRLTALKALENPEWLVGALQPSEVNEMRRLSRLYQENPIESILCVVVSTKDEARHWMELRHATGESEGAGIVRWGSDDASRFRARTGNIDFHTQALNLLEEEGQLTPAKRRNVPAASLKRVLGTPEVRAKLGIDVKEGRLEFTGDRKRAIKALMYVVNDLESGKTKTSDIYTKDLRIKYAEDLPASLATKTAKPSTNVAKSLKSGPTSTASRDRLIPTKCVLSIGEQRLQDIARELRRLSLKEHTNAVSVLFRVFVELSADSYIEREGLNATADDKLSRKLQVVTEDLLARKKLTKQQATPIRLVCHKDSFLAPSTALMNEYVHNKFISPAPGDLRAYWDSIQPFITAVWAP